MFANINTVFFLKKMVFVAWFFEGKSRRFFLVTLVHLYPILFSFIHHTIHHFFKPKNYIFSISSKWPNFYLISRCYPVYEWVSIWLHKTKWVCILAAALNVAREEVNRRWNEGGAKKAQQLFLPHCQSCSSKHKIRDINMYSRIASDTYIHISDPTIHPSKAVNARS